MVQDTRRRQYWVNPRFQRRFIRTILWLELAVVGAVACLVGLGWFIFLLADQFVFHVVVYIGLFLLIAGGLIGSIVFITVRTSSKICGPVFKMLDHMNTLSQGGHTEPLKIRADDYFEELEEAFNDLLDFIEKLRMKETFETPDSNPRVQGVFER